MQTATDIIATAEPVAPPAREDIWLYGYWYEKSQSWIVNKCHSEAFARERAADSLHGFVARIPGSGPSLLDAERARSVAVKAREDAEGHAYQGDEPIRGRLVTP